MTHQIKNRAPDVNAPILAAELDDVYAALLADADNLDLYAAWQSSIDAYRGSLVTPWSIRWRNIGCVPKRRFRFRDPDRRSNLNALRRAVTAAKRRLRSSRKEQLREQVEAEAALVAAEDALAIYRQMPSLLTPSDLERVIGSPHEHQ